MDLSLIRSLLEAPVPVRALESVDSTNRAAKDWALEGAPHGACVLAARQTKGRGRLGRQFFSPPGGLYMSVILRLPQKQVPGLTALAAVAVCRAAAETAGAELLIKWVNDLLLQGRKVAGILAEGTGSGEGDRAIVVGVGVNAAPAEFPPELRANAGSLQLPPTPGAKERLAAAIVNHLLRFSRPGQPFMDEYRSRCVTLGRDVRISAETGSGTEGLAVGVDDAGALLVRTASGLVRVVSGEASIRLLDGSYA